MTVILVTLIFVLPVCAQGDPEVAKSSKEIVPLIFPVVGPLSEPLFDSFGNARTEGRQHHGQDLMARKMTPLVAAFDGRVEFARKDTANAHNLLFLYGDNSCVATYMHINNDTPGSDNDGMGSREYAFAPNLRSGMQVVAGQFLGWVGNSGNAESVGPHLHFELKRNGVLINPFESLKQAQRITEPRYIPPASAEAPKAGEVRMDAVVRSVDPNRQMIAAWAVAYLNDRGKQTVVTAPQQKWLRVSSGTVLVRRESIAQLVTLSELQAGDEVTVFLPEKVEEEELAPRRILAELLPRRNPAFVASRPSLASRGGTLEAPLSERVTDQRRGSLPPRNSVSTTTIRQDPAVLLAPPVNLAERLKDYVNLLRRNRRLSQITQDQRLDHAAQAVAESLNQNGFDGRVNTVGVDCEQRMRENDYKPVEFYVCVCVGQSTPEKAVESLRTQRSAQVSLFHPAMKEIGVGYAEGNIPGRGFQRFWILILAAP